MKNNKLLISFIFIGILVVLAFFVVSYSFSLSDVLGYSSSAVVFIGLAVGGYYAWRYFKKKEENEKLSEKDRKLRLEQMKQRFNSEYFGRAPVFLKPVTRQGFGIQRGKVTDNN